MESFHFPLLLLIFKPIVKVFMESYSTTSIQHVQSMAMKSVQSSGKSPLALYFKNLPPWRPNDTSV
ncbi:hypothetical protein Bca52824_093788 [Brassica carinata]|uniref:Uncharacterized protein n=1 Tax=Brassica carinata TaxID=52824 RepID=A0A8X7P555_BRACI|nr:hypothetical protein Bca52824_093788 [Brassica carinata]